MMRGLELNNERGLILTTNEAKLVPALAKGLFFLGKIDILGASGTNSRHLGYSYSDGRLLTNCKARR
jgi:hypothetical protein